MGESGAVFSVGLLISVIWVSVLSLGGCDIRPDEAMRILKTDGVTDIRLGKHAFFECAADDSFSIEFDGTKQTTHVSGAVCGGWSGYDSIRFR